MPPPPVGTRKRKKYNTARNLRRASKNLEKKKQELLPCIQLDLNRAKRNAASAKTQLDSARHGRAAAEARAQKAEAEARQEKQKRKQAEARAARHADTVAFNRDELRKLRKESWDCGVKRRREVQEALWVGFVVAFSGEGGIFERPNRSPPDRSQTTPTSQRSIVVIKKTSGERRSWDS